jgi:acyl dehydratase
MTAAHEEVLDAASWRQLVGREYGAVYAWDAVNQPMIRHWCEATGNTNPLYDWQAAPPSMLHAWVLPGYGGVHPPGSATEGPDDAYALLARLGYTAKIGVNSNQQYLRYLRPGDRLHYRSRIAAIGEEKRTALGMGHFVTVDYQYFDQDGELVGTMSFRQLAYRPGPTVAPPPAASRAADLPAVLHRKSDTCRRKSDLQVGDELAPMLVPVTVAGIVAGAIATRDFHPVHHDVDAVRALGMPTIFMNILTTNAYVERYVTEWAGPGARLTALDVKLGTPNYAGDCMRLAGVVSAVGAEGEQWVDVSVTGTNARGVHVTATARLVLA